MSQLSGDAAQGRDQPNAASIPGIISDALAMRLAANGLWSGARIERLAAAPFGDPLLFRVHGFRLALRVVEAARVMVRQVAS